MGAGLGGSDEFVTGAIAVEGMEEEFRLDLNEVFKGKLGYNEC